LLLFSCAILNFFILTLFFARSKHTLKEPISKQKLIRWVYTTKSGAVDLTNELFLEEREREKEKETKETGMVELGAGSRPHL
jgi:IS30 family transposase